MNQIIQDHKGKYNIFGSGIFHNPHSIFKSKYYELHNGIIDIFSGNDTIIEGYLMGMHRYLRMQKVIITKISPS